jgi:hypothetical protein
VFIRDKYVTNSSSAHCLVTNVNPKMYSDVWACEKGRFGWQTFVLISREAKKLYMAVMLLEALAPQKYSEMKATLKKRICEVNRLFGEEILDPYTSDILEYYVDHQSVIEDIPDFRKGGFLEKMCLDFINYVVDTPSIAIVGGNDNDHEPAEPIAGHYEDVCRAFSRWEKQQP